MSDEDNNQENKKDKKYLLFQNAQNNVEMDEQSNEMFNNKDNNSVPVNNREKLERKKCCKLPTTYTILLIIEFVIFVFSYIIPKGKFDTIEYVDNKFKIRYANGTVDNDIEVSQATLDKIGINIPIENFQKGHINKPISIPNTYKEIDQEATNFFKLFKYPMKGIVDAASISFFLMILGGIINFLIEIKALNSAISSLAKLMQGKDYLLVCIIYIVIAIIGSTIGLVELSLVFTPVIMPMYLKGGIDGMLGVGTIFVSIIMGTAISLTNPFSVIIASYTSGINFTDGIGYRVINFFILHGITLTYFYFYHRRVRADETKSFSLTIKEDLEDKFLSEEKQSKKNESIKDKDLEGISKLLEKDEFTLKQKISLLIFLLGFVGMIVGILVLDFEFEEMMACFFFSSLIIMVISCKQEAESYKIFMKGAGGFFNMAMVIGLSRGINTTLNDEKVADTLLNGLSDSIGNLPKVGFIIVMYLIFILLGFLIPSSSGLAILSMPIFSPLADSIGIGKHLVINSYMCAQRFAALITPTGLLFVFLQQCGVPYLLWLKFIWPYLIIIFLYLLLYNIFGCLIS